MLDVSPLYVMTMIRKAIGTNVDEEGHLRWPESRESRDELASELLGASVASRLDVWIGHAQDVIRNPEPSDQTRRGVNWERDEPYRRAFADMNEEQRRLVEQLIWETATGLLFSTLVSLDQFPGGLVDVVVLDETSQEPIASISDAGIFELHDRLYRWLDEYSQTAAGYRLPSEGEG